MSSLVEYGEGTLWIGTDGGGLNAFDRSTETFTHYKNLPYDPHSLSSNNVVSLFEDRGGVFWIGTENGLNKFNRLAMKTFMKHYTHNPRNPKGLNDNNISSIYEDQKGVLWIGTLKGLNKFEREIETFGHYPGLGDSHVSATYEDRERTFWIGTFGDGLNKFDRDTGTLTSSYKHHPGDSQSLSHNTVTVIYEDQSGDLWIGTFGGGLNKFDRNKNIFTHYCHNPDDPQSLSDDDVWSIYEDRQGILWIGTWGGGLNKFDRKQEIFTHYRNDPDNPQSLSNNNVWSIYEDRQGILWIGTEDGGLNRFDRQAGTFTSFTEKNGLASNNVRGILEDNEGNLWLSTGEGVSRFDIQRKTFKNYNGDDGLQQGGLKSAVYQSRSGEMFFGGNNGVNAFYPDRIQDNPHIPPIVFTAFKKFVQGKAVEQPIPKTGGIKLPDDNASFYFEFAALDYTEPEKNQYMYMLKGFDRDWVIADATRRFAQYTNLGIKEYTFRVQGSNSDGVWNEKGKGIEVQIRILPPWWQRLWGVTLIVLVAVFGSGVGFTGYSISQYRARKRAEKMANRLRAVNKIGQQLTSGLRLSEQKILELIHEQASLLMDTQNVYVTLYDPEQQMLIFFPEVKDGKPSGVQELPRTRRTKDETESSPTERVVLEKEPLFIPDLQDWYKEHNIEFPYEEPSPKFWVGIPMIFEDKVLGVVTLWNNDKKQFYEQDDLEVLRMMTNQAAIALKNAKLYAGIEQELQTYKKKIEEAEQMILADGFTTDILHRVPNLVGSIPVRAANIISKITQGRDDETERAVIKQLEGIARDAKTLMRSVKEWNPLDEFRQKKPEDVGILLNSALRHVVVEGDIKLELDLDDNLPKVMCNPKQLFESFRCIMENGIQAMDEKKGTLSVRARTSQHSDKKVWVDISIADTGIGIAPEDQPKIFELSFTTKRLEDKGGAGWGYGLWRARSIITSICGTINVNSKIGKGTVFMISLPTVTEDQGEQNGA